MNCDIGIIRFITRRRGKQTRRTRRLLEQQPKNVPLSEMKTSSGVTIYKSRLGSRSSARPAYFEIIFGGNK